MEFDVSSPEFFALKSNVGFAHAPASKLWIVLLFSTTLISVIVEGVSGKPGLTSLYEKHHGRLSRTFIGPFIAHNVGEMLTAILLIYLMRVVERRFGTKKFINGLITTHFISQMVQYLILRFIVQTRIAVTSLPAALPTCLFLLFFQFVIEIPADSTSWFSNLIPAGSHHVILAFLAQYFSLTHFWNLIFPAAVAVCAYHYNALYLQRVYFIPEVIAQRFADPTQFPGNFVAMFEHAFESSHFRPLPIAATLERQRIEAEDDLRHRLPPGFGGDGSRGSRVGGAGAAASFAMSATEQVSIGPPPEALVRNLMDMGFDNRTEVLRALQDAEHDLTVAANLLLQRVVD